jgi:hypothetical protein
MIAPNFTHGTKVIFFFHIAWVFVVSRSQRNQKKKNDKCSCTLPWNPKNTRTSVVRSPKKLTLALLDSKNQRHSRDPCSKNALTSSTRLLKTRALPLYGHRNPQELQSTIPFFGDTHSSRNLTIELLLDPNPRCFFFPHQPLSRSVPHDLSLSPRYHFTHKLHYLVANRTCCLACSAAPCPARFLSSGFAVRRPRHDVSRQPLQPQPNATSRHHHSHHLSPITRISVDGHSPLSPRYIHRSLPSLCPSAVL